TLISKEPDPAYSRVALPYILSKEKNLRQITLQEDDYFKANNVETIIGTGASALDTKNKTIALEDARSLSYDKLLIATGSTSRVPPVEGIEDADVCYHWTLADTRKLEDQMAPAKTCFVIGAGFISLLTVSALTKAAPLKYTVVEIADQVMPQLLDKTGGDALERGMREKGIAVLLSDSVSAIERRNSLSASGGARYGVTLKSGKTYDADMIVCGTGVRPNVDFAKESGINITNGIVTTARQETNLPDVYAAGDCAETHDFLSGERCVHAIWPTAIDQGRVAGANMSAESGSASGGAGDTQTYPGSLSWNVTELFGLASASVGEFRDRPGLEPIVFHNAAANIYRKLLLDGNRIVGAVVIGRAEHIQDLGVVQAMIRRKTDISRWKNMLAGERINYGMLAYGTIKK
ncbi:MAG TPA: FAD-dependent oxidoreductase, partial [Dehalococcoidia bacterium]|nr:FAD-dependent oxidoreductase [Dehalococcoidia bacterium]